MILPRLQRSSYYLLLFCIILIYRGHELENLARNASFVGDTAHHCSSAQLKAINKALPDHYGHCSGNKYTWMNKCPISQITGCPQPLWLDRYYQEHAPTTTLSTNHDFVAINIGCNKGFDAINYLRMGSNDPSVSKAQWLEHLPTLLPGVCGQENDEYEFKEAAWRHSRKARVYCVEPITATYTALYEAAKKTQYDQKGLAVLQYAINNKEPNQTMFPKARNGTGGAEKEGVENCHSRRPTRQARLQKECELINTTRLDLLVDQMELKMDQIIDVLLIDVEGWDYEVLMGGRNTLQRTAYLEFEYNWRGMWWQRKDEKPLLQAITMLDKMGFSCYWAGKNQLWRITGCWLKHYEGLFWSNVVCVNRFHAPTLAENMESLFLQTIQ